MNRLEYETLIRRDPSAALFLEYHPPSKHQAEYWRAKPRHVVRPTDAVLKARLFFGEKNYSSFGVRGKRLVNGVAMPPCCQVIQASMRGRKFSHLTTRERRLQSTLAKVDTLRAFTRLGRALEEMVRAVSAAQ